VRVEYLESTLKELKDRIFILEEERNNQKGDQESE